MSEQTITLKIVLDYIDERIETLTGTKPYVTSKAEELQKAKMYFLNMKEFTVTFIEGNGVSGVSVQVYSDPNLEDAIGAPLTTNEEGKATTNLVSGTYYFKATKADYVDEVGTFTVAVADKTVPFEMEADV